MDRLGRRRADPRAARAGGHLHRPGAAVAPEPPLDDDQDRRVPDRGPARCRLRPARDGAHAGRRRRAVAARRRHRDGGRDRPPRARRRRALRAGGGGARARGARSRGSTPSARCSTPTRGSGRLAAGNMAAVPADPSPSARSDRCCGGSASTTSSSPRPRRGYFLEGFVDTQRYHKRFEATCRSPGARCSTSAAATARRASSSLARARAACSASTSTRGSSPSRRSSSRASPSSPIGSSSATSTRRAPSSERTSTSRSPRTASSTSPTPRPTSQSSSGYVGPGGEIAIGFGPLWRSPYGAHQRR